MSSARATGDLVRSFSLFGPEMDTKSEEIYRSMRSDCPVGWSEELGGYWVVSSYDAASQVLRNPAVFSSAEIAVPSFHDEWGPMLPQQVDPPEHALYRRDLNQLLAPARVAAFEAWAREFAGDLWDRIALRGGGELKAEFCVPYTSQVAMRFLGFAPDEIEQYQEWNARILASLDPDAVEAKAELANDIKPRIYECLAGVLSARASQTNPPDDVITGLTRARRGDRPYSLDEQVRTLHLLINAGLDTTNNVIGASLWFLAGNSTHLDRLGSDPTSIPAAVEEFARYFNNTAVARVVTTETDLGGCQLKPGDLVEVLLPSACRDDDAFGDGEAVRFDRLTNPHLSFSVGPHRCLGSHLARMEMRVAFETLVDRISSMRLVSPGKVRWESTYVRKIEQIDVAIVPRRVVGSD